jgi:hypothetical protein
MKERKMESMKTVITSLSIPKYLIDWAREHCKDMPNKPSLSAYLCNLIYEDQMANNALEKEIEEFREKMKEPGAAAKAFDRLRRDKGYVDLSKR